MIDAISSSFYSTLVGLDSSFLSDSQRQRDTSDQRAPVRVNTDATGLRVSAELRQAIAAARGLPSTGAERASGENAPAVFSGLLAGGSYPVYTARGDLAGGHLAGAGVYGQEIGFGGVFGDASSAISPEKALAAYRRAGGETGLAPWGTGISLQV